MTPREMYKHIWSLTAQLNEEEKTEFFKEAEEEGFLKRRTRSMLVSPSLNIYSVTVGNISNNTLCIPFKTVTREKNVETQAMIDCRAGGVFIDQNFAKNFKQRKLDHPLTAKNVDGTVNKKGIMENYVDLKFKIDSRKFKEYITGLGRQKIILGFPWLKKYNPTINWKTGKIKQKKYLLTFQQLFGKNRTSPQPTIEEQLDEEEWKTRTRNPINKNMNAIFMELLNKEIRINKINVATELAIKENKKKTEKTDKELVPKEYHKYSDVFNKEKAAQFPESKP